MTTESWLLLVILGWLIMNTAVHKLWDYWLDRQAQQTIRLALLEGRLQRQTVIRIAQGDTQLFSQLNNRRMENALHRFADRKMSLIDVGIRIEGGHV